MGSGRRRGCYSHTTYIHAKSEQKNRNLPNHNSIRLPGAILGKGRGRIRIEKNELFNFAAGKRGANVFMRQRGPFARTLYVMLCTYTRRRYVSEFIAMPNKIGRNDYGGQQR